MAQKKVIIISVVVVITSILIAGIIAAVVLVNRNDTRIVKEWWQTTVLYQIYPRSFKDSDGDGIGDLKGITENLEHFVDAGIDAVWISPIFTSPMVDFGYDISNFYEIHYEYGTMEDFDELIAKAHELGLKVLLDFVANHASNESDYFIRSVAREPGYEDFFIWDDGLEDPTNPNNRLPPSNWVSQFGGSTWTWHPIRQQYYLHQFAVEQADFNFRNPVVRQEMINILEFWLDKGADGFRLDALPYLIEARKEDHDGRYPDDPLSNNCLIGPNEFGYTIPIYTKDLIDLYEVVYEWRDFIEQYNQDHPGTTRVILSEAYANVSMTMLYYGDEVSRLGAHFPFNFDLIMEVDGTSSARDIVYVIQRWLTYMPAGSTANWVLGNHDRNRMATRYRPELVDGLNALDLLLPGVAVTYQGDEIGMTNGYVSWEDTVDVQACNIGNPDNYLEWSRDPARTPFHWDNSTSAGFSTNNSTWLPVAENYLELNLAAQKEAERSHYKVYQRLTAARRESTIQDGDYILKALSEHVLLLIRYLESQTTYILLVNFSEDGQNISLSPYDLLPDQLTVYIAGETSTRNIGDTLQKSSISLVGSETLVLTSLPLDQGQCR